MCGVLNACCPCKSPYTCDKKGICNPPDVRECGTDLCTKTRQDMYDNSKGTPQACCCDTDSPYLVQWTSTGPQQYICLPNSDYANFKQFIVPGPSGSTVSSSPCSNPTCNNSRCPGNTCNYVTECGTDNCTNTGRDMYDNSKGTPQACCCDTDSPYLIQWSTTDPQQYICLSNANYPAFKQFIVPGSSGSTGSSSPCSNPTCNARCAGNKCNDPPPDLPECGTDVCTTTGSDMYNNSKGTPQACCCKTDMPYSVKNSDSGCRYVCLDSLEVANGKYKPEIFCDGTTGSTAGIYSSAPCKDPICGDTNCTNNNCKKQPEQCVPPCSSSQTCVNGICKDTICWDGQWGPSKEWEDMYLYSGQLNNRPICCGANALPYLYKSEQKWSPDLQTCRFVCLNKEDVPTADQMTTDPKTWCGKTGPTWPCVNPYQRLVTDKGSGGGSFYGCNLGSNVDNEFADPPHDKYPPPPQ
jgi:hypothetical protein